MLFLPKGALPPKKNVVTPPSWTATVKAGYARGHGPSGHWLRARASVVNTNTDAMSRWRHLFNVAKINYKATQPGGSNTAPVLGITPAEAWLYQSATYVGILLAGLYEGGIQLMQTLIGCSSVEAYEVMVSTTLAQMNQPTPIAPPITTVSAVGVVGPVTATAGTASLSVEGITNPQLGPINAAFQAYLTISGYTMPATPAPTAKVAPPASPSSPTRPIFRATRITSSPPAPPAPCRSCARISWSTRGRWPRPAPSALMPSSSSLPPSPTRK